MGKKRIVMRVVTWNVGCRDASLLDALARFGEFDVVTLQEVGIEVPDIFQDRLVEKMGLKHVYYSRRVDVPCQDGVNLIASRWPLQGIALCYSREELPWPQALTEVSVSVGGRSIVVITAHIPNGSKYGWQKIDTFHVLNKLVRKASGAPCIVTGDFNEPQYTFQDRRVVTWGQQWDAHQGRFVCWPTWKDRSGRPDSGERWDSEVRWLFEKEDEHGLRHAYWEAQGRPAKVASHKTHGRRRWFDHIFVSRNFFQVKECTYLHQLRRPHLSDHSALAAMLSFDAQR